MRFCSSIILAGSVLISNYSLVQGAEIVVGGMKVHFESVDPKFSMPTQFDVDLIVSEKGKKILEFDSNGSTLKKVVDSTGKDLTGKSDFSFFSNGPKDNSRRTIQISTKNDTPAMGASWVHLQGTALVSVGSETEEVTTELIELSKGTKFEVKGHKIEITGAEKPRWGDAKWQISVKSNQPFTRVAKWQLETPEGKIMEVEKGGSGTASSFGKTTYSMTLQFEEKIEKAKLKLGVYADFETLEVPIDLKVGMGK